MFDLAKIHAFEVLGKKFVYDTGTCHAFEIDDVCHDILERAGRFCEEDMISQLSDAYGREKTEIALRELAALSEQGRRDNQNAPAFDEALNFVILHVTRSCNLRCKYCFQGNGTNGNGAFLMGREVGTTAIDLLIEASGPRKSIAVGFSGGEPLLNFELIKHIVEHARAREREVGKRFHFQITTNGVLLKSEIVSFLDDNDFSVDISIDGSGDMHDKARIFQDGDGSFNAAMEGALRLLDKPIGKNTTIQTVLFRDNRSVFETIPTLFDLGFPRVVVSPVILPGDSELAIHEGGLTEVMKYYDAFVSHYVRRIRRGGCGQLTNLVDVIRKLHLDEPRKHMCGAGVKRVVVAPDGKLYPCHMFDGADALQMGSVLTGIDETMRKTWVRSRDIDSHAQCRDCWAKHLCGGGCRAIGYCLDGSLAQPPSPFCDFKKADIERAIYTYSELDEGSVDRLLS